MVRIKESLTIEQDLLNYARKKALELQISTSEFINQIIKKEMEDHYDIWTEFEKIQQEKTKLETKEKEATEKMNKFIEEGTKKERVEAEKRLAEEKRLLEKEKQENNHAIQRFLSIINKYDLFKELIDCSKKEDLEKLMIKAARILFDSNSTELVPYAYKSVIFNYITENKEELQNKLLAN